MRKGYFGKTKVMVLLFSFMSLFTLFGVEKNVKAVESFLWPVPNYTNIYQNYSSGHRGIDISQGGISGKPVVATKSGVVVDAKDTCSCGAPNSPCLCNGRRGNYVVIRHNDGGLSRYLHLQYGSVAVRVGQTVNRGSQIGLVGSSGESYGYHLHFDLATGSSWDLNNRYDPMSVSYAYTLTPTNPTPTISGANSPGTLTVGNVFSISGTVSAGATITNVTAGCYDVNGNMKTGKSANPNSTSYNIKNLDPYVYFNYLTPGVYKYKVTATTSAGTTTLVDKAFIVLANQATVADGTYQLQVAADTQYGVGIKDDSVAVSANAELVAAKDTAARTFDVKHVGGGYYSLCNRKSGLYLDVQGGGSAASTNVNQYTGNGSNAQQWQILPAGNGGYCLVPRCGTANCLDMQGGTIREGTNLIIHPAHLGKNQIIKLVAAKGEEQKGLDAPKTVKAVLTGHDDVKVSWSAVDGADGYVVHYKKSSAKSYTKLKTTTSRSCSVKDLTDGTKYTFRVAAYSTKNGEKTASPNKKTASVTTLKKVSTPKVAKASSGKVKVSWTNVAGETGYQISRSTSKTKTNVISTYKTTDGTSKTFGTTLNKTYYYKVRAYKTVGDTKVYGPWSDVKSYKLKGVAALKDAKAVLYGHDDVKVTWKKASGANKYAVYYKKASEDSYTYLGKTTGTSYKKKNLADGVKYTFKIVPQKISDGVVRYKGTADTASVTTLKKVSTPKVSKSSSKKVKISWTNIAGETGYQISRSTSKTETKVIVTYKTTSGKSKTLGVSRNKTFYYKVRAYKTVNGKKIYGPWSDVKKYKLK